MDAMTEQLRLRVKEAFPAVETVIGWGAGFDPVHTMPLFIRSPDAADRLVWGPFCTQNLTGYLVKPPRVQPADPSGKIGICVKGCDSRSLVALLQEKFIDRDRLFIFGIPCRGTVDWRRVMRRAVVADVRGSRIERDRLIVTDRTTTHAFPLEEVLARRCLRCRHPNPVVFDVMVGEPVEPRATDQNAWRDVEALEGRTLADRLAFWQSELNRCMRCYACRNACPLCVCQDRCIVETRDPKWLTQRMGTAEKFLFHCIHAQHLAGRCTECGECERVCPMEIPVTLMKEKLNRTLKELLHYEAGLDPEAVPPLLTFDPGETGL